MTLNSSKNADKESSASFGEFNFKEGEKVLCYHGPLIYFAKCMQARLDKTTGVVEYHIHYSGWNKSWDEWVPESRVLKINDENLQKQKDLHKAQKSEGAKKSKKKKNSLSVSNLDVSGDTSLDNATSSPSIDVKVSQTEQKSIPCQDVVEVVRKRKKSRISESSGSQDDQMSCKINEVHAFTMPERLETLLAQDCINIKQCKKLMKLPSTYTIDSIIEEYITEIVKNNPKMKSSEKELVKGLSDYFNAFANTSLLYQIERLQYDEILKDDPNVCVSKVYGVVHLLRLLLKFPKKFADSSLLPKQKMEFILSKIKPFISFVENNIDKFLSNLKYENASMDYLNKAENYMIEG